MQINASDRAPERPKILPAPGMEARWKSSTGKENNIKQNQTPRAVPVPDPAHFHTHPTLSSSSSSPSSFCLCETKYISLHGRGAYLDERVLLVCVFFSIACAAADGSSDGASSLTGGLAQGTRKENEIKEKGKHACLRERRQVRKGGSK